MLTPEEYTLAWAVYLAASLLMVLSFWGLTRWISLRPLRLLLRGLVAVIMLTPVDIPPSDNEWAPAVATVFFDVVTHENYLPLVGPAYFFACAGLLLLLILDLMLTGGRDKKAK